MKSTIPLIVAVLLALMILISYNANRSIDRLHCLLAARPVGNASALNLLKASGDVNEQDLHFEVRSGCIYPTAGRSHQNSFIEN